jgi:hypothetical protein
MDAVTEAYDGKIQMIDSTSVRVHSQGAALKKKIETFVSVEGVAD